MALTDRLQHAWNAFMSSRDPTPEVSYAEYGNVTTYRPDRLILSRGNEKSITTSIFNRIALDVAAITIRHVRLDENDRMVEPIESGLDYCINVEANIDQTGRAFIQDLVMSMLDEGVVAVVPVDTNINPKTGAFEVKTLRVGQIVQWYPKHVKVRLYNEQNGKKTDVVLPKNVVAIIENPLYSVINEPNSTMQRLKRKLALLDAIDEQTGSGKLDLIIQLPYTIKTPKKEEQAENRRKSIETQLKGSKYGIAYTDSTERIIQLNRPIENNLLPNIEYLTKMAYSQLGITTEIMDGTANDQTMLNYQNRTIEPIVSTIVDEFKRKFLTKTARTQKQSILFFRDPFRLAPVDKIAEMADKFTRNEIMSSNEFRQVIGLPPSKDPRADELRNKNLNKSDEEIALDQNIQNGNSSEEDMNEQV